MSAGVLWANGWLLTGIMFDTAMHQAEETADLWGTLGVSTSKKQVAAARGDFDTPPEEMTTKPVVVTKVSKRAA